MNINEAYNAWADTYDSVQNKTRDTEGEALRTRLGQYTFDCVLEVGCGTGKNTEWFITRAKEIVAVDFSEQMLNRARERFGAKAEFIQADITQPWPFEASRFDVVTFSLVLEHIENLGGIFDEAKRVLRPGGLLYLGELHPAKQYLGSKARFETGKGVFELECFVHHLSDFLKVAKERGFRMLELDEWFAIDDTVPRVLTLIFDRSA